VEHVVRAAVVDSDDLVDADVLVDNAVLVDADVVAAATTHTARNLLHVTWSTLLAPPSLTMTSLLTPTLWPPPRRTRRGNCCTLRGACCSRRRRCQ